VTAAARTTEAPRPYTLVAELSYRCPLSCGYCSNPLELDKHAAELDTATWRRVLGEAAALGILQANFTGGEPLVRDDLEELIAEARAHDLYINLITSGVPLDHARLSRLRAAGLDSLQLSVQDTDGEGSKWIAGRDCTAAKLEAAAAARALGLPITLNVVLHRGNIARVPEFVALAERLGAERLELANTQYLGWALVNREALLPSQAQLGAARRAALAASERLKGKIEILFVRPDYDVGRPRACMDGWAQRYVVVTPDGTALPCHQARSITTLSFADCNVRDRTLGAIWSDASAFRAYRGEAWMSETCRSCDERHRDFGGCRCQAFALTGDAAATDPACDRAPAHDLVLAARLHAERSEPATRPPLRLRRMRAS
jgi:pyrroloquinoline quinone biosynthesis protein E